MKVIIKSEPNDNNIMEFDCAFSGLTQEELVRNVYAVAKEWIERYESDNLNRTKA